MVSRNDFPGAGGYDEHVRCAIPTSKPSVRLCVTPTLGHYAKTNQVTLLQETAHGHMVFNRYINLNVHILDKNFLFSV